MKKIILLAIMAMSLTGCMTADVINTIKPIAWEVAKAKIKTEYPVAASAIQLLGRTGENFVVKYPIDEDGIKKFVVAIVCQRTLDVLESHVVK